MKAMVYHRYGGPDVVALAEVPKPVLKDNEVLIRIRATTVTTGDWRARSLVMPRGFGLMAPLVFGLFRPRQPILGTELAGEIEAIGNAVTRFRVSDPVFAFTGGKYGCHAEYRTMPEDGLIVLKPANLSFDEAAALSFGGTTALPFLRDRAGIKSGDSVLVVGASGAVGSAAVQIAKHFGAEVTGVCSTVNLDLVRSIGADRAINYTQEDAAMNGETYDIIFDTTGTMPYVRCGAMLKPGGVLWLFSARLRPFWAWAAHRRQVGRQSSPPWQQCASATCSSSPSSPKAASTSPSSTEAISWKMLPRRMPMWIQAESGEA